MTRFSTFSTSGFHVNFESIITPQVLDLVNVWNGCAGLVVFTLLRGSSCRISLTNSLDPHIIALVLDALSLRAASPAYSNTLFATLDQGQPANRFGDRRRKRNAVIHRPCLYEDRNPPRLLEYASDH